MKKEKHWIRFISGIILFYGTEILERNAKFTIDVFFSKPAILRYLQGYPIANAGFSPKIYPIFQFLAIVFIVAGIFGILKNKFNN